MAPEGPSRLTTASLHSAPVTPAATMPRRKAEGDAEENKPRWRTSHREDLQGCLLSPLLQSHSPSLKRPLQRRERGYPRGRRGRWIQVRMQIILQRMQMTKQTQHKKLKALESQVTCVYFYNCVLLVTVQF